VTTIQEDLNAIPTISRSPIANQPKESKPEKEAKIKLDWKWK